MNGLREPFFHSLGFAVTSDSETGLKFLPSPTGNWVEERVLMHNTGEPRYNRWEDSIGEEGPRDNSIVAKRWTKGGKKVITLLIEMLLMSLLPPLFSNIDYDKTASLRPIMACRLCVMTPTHVASFTWIVTTMPRSVNLISHLK